MQLITKIILGFSIENEDITQELYNICDREHASCNNDCPVFAVGGEVPLNADGRNCSCFKDGIQMRDFILRNKRRVLDREGR